MERWEHALLGLVLILTLGAIFAFSSLMPCEHRCPTRETREPKEERLVVIVPYRARDDHLSVFAPYLHNWLLSHGMKGFQILIIEQMNGERFNRGKLLNIGFNESLTYDYFVFHDVDLLPSNSSNTYALEASPFHLSGCVKRHGYKMPYPSYGGGVISFTREHYLRVNGHSNRYEGWGAEDDDLVRRIQLSGLRLHRFPSLCIGRYEDLPHPRPSPSELAPNRMKLLKEAAKTWHQDGLNSLNYTVLQRTEKEWFTHLRVQI